MFESSFIESARPNQAGHRILSVPFSLALHAVALGSAFAASVWTMQEPPEPSRTINFAFLSPGPPAAPAAKPAPAQSPRDHVQPKPIEQTFSPVVIPQAPPVRDSEDAPDMPADEESTVVGGLEGGTGGPRQGILGGIGEGGPGAGGPETGHDEIVRPGGAVSEPVEIGRVQPAYPEAARRARIEGTVILEAVITKDGTVGATRVLRGVHPLLDLSAVSAVSMWRYEPARFNGRPVPVYLTVTVTFKLF